ncbi:flavin reductase family protein [Gordonia lacunae]|uniref:flavin reductase family protein n=1 Tax=Gordonia lacunae TaxID=417102 RepID=UPI0039E4A7D9
MRATSVRSTPVFVCSLHDEIRAGDRSIVLVRIDEFELSPDGAPLVFHRSGYHTLAR